VKAGEATIKALVIGAVLTLAFGACAQAHGHGAGHRLSLHRGVSSFAVPRASAPVRDRSIRSGDHFGWRQGEPRV
jgi:hypothetical protein